MKSGEWWDYSWNIAPGCTQVSAECDHCWALAMAKRLQGMGKAGYEGLVDALPPTPPHLQTQQMGRGVRWTGRVNLLEKRLKDPLELKRPRVIAVNLMGDLFHENVPDLFLHSVFDVMARAERHRFMVLTKRPERAVKFLRAQWVKQEVQYIAPLRNVWIGTTAGMQRSANERWNAMSWIAQAGWNTWVSSEPRLEAIDWHGWSFLKWMVTGGESGPYARPMVPAWARADRDWCVDHGVAFWFKQWGEWGPEVPGVDLSNYPMTTFGREILFRFGRKMAGRMLNGRTWEEVPFTTKDTKEHEGEKR